MDYEIRITELPESESEPMQAEVVVDLDVKVSMFPDKGFEAIREEYEKKMNQLKENRLVVPRHIALKLNEKMHELFEFEFTPEQKNQFFDLCKEYFHKTLNFEDLENLMKSKIMSCFESNGLNEKYEKFQALYSYEKIFSKEYLDDFLETGFLYACILEQIMQLVLMSEEEITLHEATETVLFDWMEETYIFVYFEFIRPYLDCEINRVNKYMKFHLENEDKFVNLILSSLSESV